MSQGVILSKHSVKPKTVNTVNSGHYALAATPWESDHSQGA